MVAFPARLVVTDQNTNGRTLMRLLIEPAATARAYVRRLVHIWRRVHAVDALESPGDRIAQGDSAIGVNDAM